MEREELVQTLLNIDEEAQLTIGQVSSKPRVVIVGGAAFMLREITPQEGDS